MTQQHVGPDGAFRPGSAHRRRGFGNVYLRGNIWWVYYSYQGAKRRESAHTRCRRAAVLFLRDRIRRVAATAAYIPERGTLGLADYRWLDAPR